MGIEYLSSIHLELRDASRFAAQIAVFCPRLREIRVDASLFGIECLWIDLHTPDSIIRSEWTPDLVQQSRWYGEIRPLSGLKKASIVVTVADFRLYDDHSSEERARILSNTALIQSEFEKSATRPAEVPPLLPDHSLTLPGFPEINDAISHASFAMGVRLIFS